MRVQQRRDDQQAREGREERLLSVLADYAARLLASADPASVVDHLFETIREELQLDVFFHFRVAGDGHLAIAACGGVDRDQRAAVARLRIGQAVCGTVAKDRIPRAICEIQASDDPMVEFIRSIGVECYACTPVVHGEVLLGTLSFGRKTANPFVEAEQRFLRTVASYVALAWNRVIVERELMEALKARDALLNAQIGLIKRIGDQPEAVELSTVASMLAHEMAQPLSAASNYISAVEAALNGTGGADAVQRLAQARAQISRSSQIIARTLALAGPDGEVERQYEGLVEMLDEAIELVSVSGAGWQTQISTRIGEGIDQVLADRVQIVQLLANLLRNALQALAGRADAQLRIEAERGGEEVTIRVIDNGPGFPGGQLPEPSKSTTGGRGIGLSICRRIAERHDGRFELSETPGGGATISFSLPARVH